MNDKYQFIIALIIIVPFISYIGIFYWNDMAPEAKDILTTLGAFVGTIVGFYFGQRPVQNLTKQVSDATSKNESAKKTVVNVTDQIDSDSQLIDALKQKIQTQDQIIENLLSKNDDQ